MTKEIQLTQGKVAIVDDDDYELVSQYKWHATQRHNTWYAETNSKGGRVGRKKIALHRLIMQPPDDMVVDHWDWNGLNCTRENMRICTNLENINRHRGDPRSTVFGAIHPRCENKNPTGYKGVSRELKKWRAQLKVNRKYIRVGVFDTVEEAARAYDRAARKYLPNTAYLNFPDESSERE